MPKVPESLPAVTVFIQVRQFIIPSVSVIGNNVSHKPCTICTTTVACATPVVNGWPFVSPAHDKSLICCSLRESQPCIWLPSLHTVQDLHTLVPPLSLSSPDNHHTPFMVPPELDRRHNTVRTSMGHASLMHTCRKGRYGTVGWDARTQGRDSKAALAKDPADACHHSFCPKWLHRAISLRGGE